MLHDLFYIEMYFGDVEAAQNTADMIERYGRDQVYTALALGLLDRKKMFSCRGIKEKDICFLSEKGRKKAAMQGA